MDKKGFLKGAALGALLASAAALICAPQSGNKTRKDAQKLAKSLLKRMIRQARTFHSVSRDAYDSVIESSLAEYAKGKKITAEYLKEMKSILSSHWGEVQKELKKKYKVKKTTYIIPIRSLGSLRSLPFSQAHARTRGSSLLSCFLLLQGCFRLQTQGLCLPPS